jgi:hypothetical protein
MNLCPKCKTEMHTNTVIVLGGKWKHYQECPGCNFRTAAK